MDLYQQIRVYALCFKICMGITVTAFSAAFLMWLQGGRLYRAALKDRESAGDADRRRMGVPPAELAQAADISARERGRELETEVLTERSRNPADAPARERGRELETEVLTERSQEPADALAREREISRKGSGKIGISGRGEQR